MQRIGKKSWMSHSDRSNEKGISEFVAEIQTMIVNDSNKPFSSIARDMRVSEFLIRNVDFGNSHYFSWKMRNIHFFYYRPWNTREKTVLQSLRINLSIRFNRTCFTFSQMRKNSTKIRWWTHRTTVDLHCPHEMYDRNENQTPSAHHCV